MVKIRLRRVGGKEQPYYRIVVTDSKAPNDGDFIEIIGNFNPRTDPETVNIDEAKAVHWLQVGAQPTDTARRLLTKTGIIEKSRASKEKT